ncbi:DMT family transporter, partial [Gemmobacter caeni]
PQVPLAAENPCLALGYRRSSPQTTRHLGNAGQYLLANNATASILEQANQKFKRDTPTHPTAQMWGVKVTRISDIAEPDRDSPWTRLRGILWAAVALSILSGWFVVTRYSVTRALGIWDIAALRFGVGALLLAPVLLRRPGRLSRSQWREGFVFSLMWGVPFVLLVALGLTLTSAAQASAIAPTLMPLFAAIFSWAFLGDRMGPRRWGALAAILAGLSLLVVAGSATLGPPSPLGLAALVTAGAMWAIYTLRFHRSGLTPIEAAALICFWSTVLFLPLYLVLGLSRLAEASATEIVLQAFYQGVLMSGVAIFTFNRAVTLLGPVAAASIIALLPAVASLLAIPALGEIPSPVESIAIGIIAIGVLLAASRPNR